MNSDICQQTLAERLFDDLTAAILDGTLLPGAKLSEPQLARRYGVSRGPLREAMHRLQERRLIVRTANQGARVVQPSGEGLAEIFVLREALEGVAAREAALKAEPADIAALVAALARHQEALGACVDTGLPPDNAADRDFHVLIAKTSRNKLLIQLLCTELYPLLRLYRGRSAETTVQSWRAFEEHRRVLQAIEDRDGELAEIQMRRHIAAALVRRGRMIAMQVLEVKKAAPASAG